MHYYRWQRTGDPLNAGRTAPASVRFWRFVNRDGPVPAIRPDLGPCHLWTGHINPNGYGMFSVSHRTGENVRSMAHRFAYELLIGPIPEGFDVDHLCFVPACVNGAHLEAVSPLENCRRKIEARPLRPWKKKGWRRFQVGAGMADPQKGQRRA
jgi:hypothetical protein